MAQNVERGKDIQFNIQDGNVHGTVNTGNTNSCKYVKHEHLLCGVHVGFPPGPRTCGAREVLIPRTTKRSALNPGVRENKKKTGHGPQASSCNSAGAPSHLRAGTLEIAPYVGDVRALHVRPPTSRTDRRSLLLQELSRVLSRANPKKPAPTPTQGRRR